MTGEAHMRGYSGAEHRISIPQGSPFREANMNVGQEVLSHHFFCNMVSQVLYESVRRLADAVDEPGLKSAAYIWPRVNRGIAASVRRLAALPMVSRISTTFLSSTVTTALTRRNCSRSLGEWILPHWYHFLARWPS